MRAFMSAGGNRHTLLRGQVDGRTIGQRIADQGAMAEREARRILAETEPIPDGYSQADRMYRGPLGVVSGIVPYAESALADALRAFVGEGGNHEDR